MRSQQLATLLLGIMLLPGCCKKAKPIFADSEVTDQDIEEGLADASFPNPHAVRYVEVEEEYEEYEETTLDLTDYSNKA